MSFLPGRGKVGSLQLRDGALETRGEKLIDSWEGRWLEILQADGALLFEALQMLDAVGCFGVGLCNIDDGN